MKLGQKVCNDSLKPEFRQYNQFVNRDKISQKFISKTETNKKRKNKNV